MKKLLFDVLRGPSEWTHNRQYCRYHEFWHARIADHAEHGPHCVIDFSLFVESNASAN